MTAGGFASNAASSTAGLLEGVGSAIIHPRDTLHGVNDLIWGAAEKIAPGQKAWVPSQDMTGKANPIDLVIGNFKQRYGLDKATLPETLHAIKETMYKDPAGVLADAAAVLSAGGGTLTRVGEAANATKVAQAGRIAARVSRFVDPINLSAKATGAVLSPVARFGGRIGSGIMGITSGMGSDSIQMAARPTKEFYQTLRGNVTISQVADNLRDALQQLREKRGTEYRTALANLPNVLLDHGQVVNTLMQQLQEFEVKLVHKTLPNGNVRIVPNFKGSRLDAAAAPQVREVVEAVLDWPKLKGASANAMPARAMDTLLHKLDGMYSANSNARALVASVRNSVRTQLGNTVPGYNEMSARYKEVSDFLREVEPELSAKLGSNQGTMIRKLANSLNQPTEYRRTLIDALDTRAGTKLHDQLAGAALSQAEPRGLMRTVGGGSVLYLIARGLSFEHLLDALVQLTITSPRIQGEVTALAGETARRLRRAGPTVRAATTPGKLRGAMIANQPGTLPTPASPPNAPPQ